MVIKFCVLPKKAEIVGMAECEDIVSFLEGLTEEEFLGLMLGEFDWHCIGCYSFSEGC